MIIKEAIGVGATVESAREDALKKLGAGMDEVVVGSRYSISKLS